MLIALLCDKMPGVHGPAASKPAEDEGKQTISAGCQPLVPSSYMIVGASHRLQQAWQQVVCRETLVTLLASYFWKLPTLSESFASDWLLPSGWPRDEEQQIRSVVHSQCAHLAGQLNASGCC